MSGWREIPTGVYECDNSCLKILLCWYELNCVFRTDDALSWSLYKSLFPWRITLKFSSGVCYNSIMEEKRCYFASHSLLLRISCSPDRFLSSRSLCELPGQLFLPQALPVALQTGLGHGAGKTLVSGYLCCRCHQRRRLLCRGTDRYHPNWFLKHRMKMVSHQTAGGHLGLQSAQERVNMLTCISQSMRKRVRSSACSKYLWFNLLNDR